MSETKKKEFLAYGFKDASLNKIIAKTGYTKGAFYGYYKDKASLFYDLTDSCANEFIDMFKAAQDKFFDLIPQNKTHNSVDMSFDYLNIFADYVFSHLDEFKLILCCSEGTKHTNFVDDLVDIQVEKTLVYHDELQKEGKISGKLDKTLLHIFISAQYQSLFEIIRHNTKREEAMDYISKISVFFAAGFATQIKYE